MGLVKRNRIHVYHTASYIELNNTLFALLVWNRCDDFKFIRFKSISDIKRGQTAIFIRIFKNRFNDTAFVDDCMRKFNDSYDQVIFLDDSAGSDSMHFELLDRVDVYLKGKLPENQSIFFRDLYGRQSFSDYYHRRFDVKDDNEQIRNKLENPELAKKIFLSYNLGYGLFSMDPFAGKQRFIKNVGEINVRLLRPFFIKSLNRLKRMLYQPVIFNDKRVNVNCRMNHSHLPNSIGFQRELFLEKCSQTAYCKTGVVPYNQYWQEMHKAFATLSLFGFGEVCFRDFEAVIFGSLLLKPSMEHVVTHPNIYIPYETYIPLKWDGSDLNEVMEKILMKPMEYYDVVINARKVYLQYLESLNENMNNIFRIVYSQE